MKQNPPNFHKDLVPTDFPSLSWDEKGLADALDQLYAYVVDEVDQAIAWYAKKRQRKRRGGQFMRVGAILAAACSGLIPVLGQIFEQGKGQPGISPAWATVAVGIAAMLISLDKFWGFTSAWVRFMVAEQELAMALVAFRFEWQESKLGWDSGGPRPEHAATMIAACKSFLLEKVHATVRRETEAWVTDFQAVAVQKEGLARLAAATKESETGGINIEVTNGGDCPDGWQYHIDGGAPFDAGGTSAAAGDVVPGIRTVRVTATAKDRRLQAEKAVSVAPGVIVKVELTLT